MTGKKGRTQYVILNGDRLYLYDTTNVNSSTVRMNGVDLEITNATALGDMDINTTVEMRLGIAGTPQITITAAHVLLPSGTRLEFSTVNQYIVNSLGNKIQYQAPASHLFNAPGNALELSAGVAVFYGDIDPAATSSKDIGSPTKVWQKGFFEVIGMYDITGNDFTSSWQMPALTTPAAAITTMETITLVDNHRYAIEIWVVSMQDDGTEGNYYHLDALFKREGGGAVQEGATTSITTIEEAGAADCVFDVNGNDVRVRVAGIAAEDWHWTGKIQVVEVD